MNSKEPEFLPNAGCRRAAFGGLRSTEGKIVSLIFLESTCSAVTQEQAFCGQKKFVSGL